MKSFALPPGYLRHRFPAKSLVPTSTLHYPARMTTISKSVLILLALSALTLAQSAPKKSQANPTTPQTAATAGSENAKGQKDAAANKKGSGSHTGSMSDNHKDVMETVAPNPSTGGQAQPATKPAPNSSR